MARISFNLSEILVGIHLQIVTSDKEPEEVQAG
jgi:hypothetical protein